MERGTGARILVADDELRIRTVACRILKYLGYQPVAVEDGDQMMETFRAEDGAFELVMLDLGMPGPDGPEAVRALRAIRKETRVVVSTGALLDEVRPRFSEVAPDQYLQKPYTIREVQAMLAAVFPER